MGIGAAQPGRPGAAVEVHHHPMLCSTSQQVLHALERLLRVIFPKVYLDARDAPFFPSCECLVHPFVGEFLTVTQGSRLPQEHLDSTTGSIVHRLANGFRLPSAIHQHVLPSHSGSQIDVKAVGSLACQRRIAASVGTSPVPCGPSGTNPLRVGKHAGRTQVLGHRGLEDDGQRPGDHHAPGRMQRQG